MAEVKARPTWATYCASLSEDIIQAIIGFVWNGLNLLYDQILKSLPILGRFFSHRWVEQTIKLCTGITIGQGIAADVGYLMVRPVGKCFGLVLDIFLRNRQAPRYAGQFGKFLFRLSAQMVGGAILGLSLYGLICFGLEMISFSSWGIGVALLSGSVIGLVGKLLFLMAIHSVQSAHAATIKRNVQRAKELNDKLKHAAKIKVKSRVLIHAQDIIQQMNGPQAQQHLESFFRQQYDTIASSLHHKIERHFNYLSDRACHGDFDALQRLKELVPSRLPPAQGGKNHFETMLDRIFNRRAIFRLKDDVDTAFDQWKYARLGEGV